MVRSYGQYCAVARSLDVVGDRWTLLVVRELLDGPMRYGDLLTALAPIATDMLAARLRDLEAHGVVSRRELPRPATGRVYELTELGRQLEDVVNAHARWGKGLLEDREPRHVVRPQWLARAVRAFARPDRPGVDVVVRLIVPEGRRTLRITETTIDDVDDDIDPDVTLAGEAQSLMAALDPRRFAELRASGALTVEGAEVALAQLSLAFGPGPATTAGPPPAGR